ncbi:hypothetical protein H8K38_01585 [Undibacterium sp. FT79W]|uniref:hypothetical protein n=1 Tax=Undibacterium sp. FT79W TaxID=2762296 RepID=UPI00164B4C86|nr:hypothetical protein [Undibacterium sp. FT79W]MBC3876491.1 hypothetical protein [Undibacterium sp. FT79W]
MTLSTYVTKSSLAPPMRLTGNKGSIFGKTCSCHLTLNAIAVIELQKAGLQHIDKGHSCTLCSSHTDGKFLYRSYRRGDRNSHQHSGLVILP